MSNKKKPVRVGILEPLMRTDNDDEGVIDHVQDGQLVKKRAWMSLRKRRNYEEQDLYAGKRKETKNRSRSRGEAVLPRCDSSASDAARYIYIWFLPRRRTRNMRAISWPARSKRALIRPLAKSKSTTNISHARAVFSNHAIVHLSKKSRDRTLF